MGTIFKTALSFFSGNLWVWVCVAVGGIALACGLYVADLKHVISAQGDTITTQLSTIKDLQQTVANKKAEINIQNATIQSQKTNYANNLEKEKKSSVVIKEKYRLMIEQINSFKGDQNVSSCQNANNFLNSVSY